MILVLIKRGVAPAIGERFGDFEITNVIRPANRRRRALLAAHHINESREITPELRISRTDLMKRRRELGCAHVL